MAEVDERIVSMQFDNAKFEKGVGQSLSTIEKLKNALNFSKQEKAFSELEKTANSISFSQLQNSLANIEKWVSPVGHHITSVFDRAMNYVEAKVKKTWDTIFTEAPTEGFKEYELKMDSVQTIMASTGESIETVNKYLDDLNLYADKTIYSFSDMTSNIGKFTNAGVKLEDAVKAIQGVSNVAAVSGANAQQASHAMYNFAQALSSGSVKLVDWKSIATASMDTQEFKQELINSAVELGTLIKEGEKFVSTTTDMNGHVSDLFDSTHAFNESLSSQWMTTDVLIKTLKKYTDETTDIGKKAFKAATEVKTFTQLLDTLKEGMGSGWTETFEKIIGDFNEAKELFTLFSDTLGTIVNKTSTIRNNLVQIWKDNGGREKLFENIKGGLETLTKVYDLSLKTLLGKKYDQAMRLERKRLSEGAEAVKEYSEAEVQAAKDIVSKGSFGNGEARIKALTDMGLDAKNVQTLVDKIVSSGYDIKSVEDMIKKSSEEVKEELDSFENTSFANVLKNIINSAKSLALAFKNVVTAGMRIANVFKASLFSSIDFEEVSYGALTFSESILSISESILKWTKSNKNLRMLRIAFDKFFSFAIAGIKYYLSVTKTIRGWMFDFAKSIIDYAIKIKEFFFGADNAIGSMSNKIASIKDSFYKWLSSLDKNSKLYKALTAVLSIVYGFKDGFKEGLYSLKVFANTAFGGALVKVKDVFVKIATGIKNFILALKDSETPVGKFKGFLSSVWNFVKELFKFISPIFGYLGDAIGRVATAIGGLDLERIIRLIAEGGIAGLIVQLNTFMSGLSAESLKNSASGFFEDLGDSISDFVDSFKPDRLLRAAISIGIIVASAMAIASLDAKQMASTIFMMGTLMGMFGVFVDSMYSMDASLGYKTVGLIANTLLKVAAAVLVMTLAVKSLASVDAAGLAKGLVGVISLLGILSVYINKTDFSKSGVGTGAGLILLANALLILTGVVKLLSMIKFEDMVYGLTAMSGILGVLWAFFKYFEAEKIISVSIGMNLMGKALLLMTGVLKLLSMIDMADLLKSLFVMASALTVIDIICNTLPDGMITKGIGLIAVSTALLILSGALKSVGSLSAGTLVKGLIGIGVALGEIAIALILMEGTLKGAAAMIVASVALKIMASAIKTVGSMSLGTILVGLVTLAGTILLITVAATALAPMIPVLLSFAGVLALLGVSFIAIGVGVVALAASAAILVASAEIIVTAVLRLIKTLADNAFQFGLLASKFIFSFIGGFLEHLPDLLSTVGEGILAILDFIATMAGPVVRKLVDILVELLNSLAYAIVDKEDEIFGAIKKVVVAIAKFAIDALKNVLGDIPGLGSLLEGASMGLEAAFDGLSAGDSGKKLVNNVEDGIKVATPSASETARKSGEDIKDSFTEGVNKETNITPYDPEAFAADPNMLKDFEKQMNERLNLSGQNGTDAASLEMDNYMTGLNDSQSEVIDIHKMLGESGYESLVDPDAYGKAADTNLNDFHKEFESNFPQTKEEGKKMSEEGATGAGTQNWRYARAAQNVCDTFAATLYKNRQLVFERGQAIAKAAADGLEGKLEIASPSKLMARDGLYTILGFVQGLDSNKRLIENASGDLGDAVVTSFTSPLDHIAAILRGEEEYDPTIRPVLDLTNVREGASEINGLFANRSVELASINGRLNANNLAAARAMDLSNQNGSKDVVAAIGLMRGDINALNETMANTELVMDSGAVVGAIKRPMDNALGRMNMLKGRRN